MLDYGFEYWLTEEQIGYYRSFLVNEERAGATIEKYLRDIRMFALWLDGRAVTKESAAQWKNSLLDEGFAPATVNTKLSAINSLFAFLRWDGCRVRLLKRQRRTFRDASQDLTQEEYSRLLKGAAYGCPEWLALVMESICATGIRVSEVRYITVEALRAGRADVSLKGKIRTILLPDRLCRKLLKYAKTKKIVSGEIFRAEDGKSLTRYKIWRAMKSLCAKANVEPSKVFPHNLRHLFATVLYQVTGDIVKLADVLGHSCVETTRIYLITTGAEHARQLEQMGLVS